MNVNVMEASWHRWIWQRRPLKTCGVLAICMLFGGAAWAQTTYGTLSNFDVFNDTGQECHGFEIELDGLSSKDVTFTFGSPYERYGNPVVVDFAGGVYVRYESSYDVVHHVFTQATPMAPAVITPTDGHACWTGGSGNYLTSGCEHFGLGISGTPTTTAYRWLIADPNTPGALQPSGTKVSIPAPSWSVAPPQPGGVGPVVQAVIPAEPPEVQQQFGDAMWAKVFVTESETDAELHHLVTDDPAVPQDATETETEWAILQNGPGGANNELANEHALGAGKKSVTRRYEFYQYTGAYDPESHEVLCGGVGGARRGGSCSMPLDGELGNYLGAQMAALNLEAFATPTPTDSAEPTPTMTAISTGTTTMIPTATVTATPSPHRCAGDCDGAGTVVVNELVTLVNVALGSASPSACAAGIPAGASVDITMLIQAVNNALSGCPMP